MDEVLKGNSNAFRLDGKAVVVTGGASGIGRAVAHRFAGSGAFVHLLDVDEDAAKKVVGEIVANGGNAKAYGCDVSEQQSVKAAFNNVFQAGRLHILVNNAGISHVGNLESTGESDFDRIFAVNVRGIYNCMYVSVVHMKENGGGTIVNMASIAGTSGLADRFAYSMSKGAVVAMTYSVAKDYITHNIRCNCISPARVHTPFVDGFLRSNYPGKEPEMFEKLEKSQPIGRMARPDEIAALALYLCSEEASLVTGSDYPIDGGFLNLRG